MPLTSAKDTRRLSSVPAGSGNLADSVRTGRVDTTPAHARPNRSAPSPRRGREGALECRLWSAPGCRWANSSPLRNASGAPPTASSSSLSARAPGTEMTLSRSRLPDRLAGTSRSSDLVGEIGGSATYGRGLARFVVLPLPSRLGRPAMGAAAGGGGTPIDVGDGADATLITTPLLNAVIARSDRVPGDRSRQGGRWLR